MVPLRRQVVVVLNLTCHLAFRDVVIRRWYAIPSVCHQTPFQHEPKFCPFWYFLPSECRSPTPSAPCKRLRQCWFLLAFVGSRSSATHCWLKQCRLRPCGRTVRHSSMLGVTAEIFCLVVMCFISCPFGLSACSKGNVIPVGANVSATPSSRSSPVAWVWRSTEFTKRTSLVLFGTTMFRKLASASSGSRRFLFGDPVHPARKDS